MQNIDIHTIADIAGRIERWLVCRNLEKMPEVFHDILGKTDRDNSVDRIQKNLGNPTIGILLCKEKKDALVELTLPKDSNIYAQQYALYLPDKQLLQAKLREWIEEQGE